MKILWEGLQADGRYLLKASTGEYDGVPPLPHFYLDKQPLFFNDDILSVAGVLLFGEYASGWLTTPRSVSPEVAEAIQQYLAPAWVGVSPVEFEPRANPAGDGSLLLTDDLTMWGKHKSEWGKPRASTMCVVPASEFAGGLTSPDGIIVSSNAHLLGKLSKRNSPLVPSIAAGLLFCETFRASTLVLDPHDDLSNEEFNNIYNLLASCKISLQRFSVVSRDSQ